MYIFLRIFDYVQWDQSGESLVVGLTSTLWLSRQEVQGGGKIIGALKGSFGVELIFNDEILLIILIWRGKNVINSVFKVRIIAEVISNILKLLIEFPKQIWIPLNFDFNKFLINFHTPFTPLKNHFSYQQMLKKAFKKFPLN